MSLFRRLRASERGAIAVEFAALAPVLAILILSGFEISRYMVAIQKVDRIAASLADYVSQAQQLNTAELNNLFSATAQIASPLSFDDGIVVVSSIYRSTGPNPPTITWQRSGGGGLAGATSSVGVQGGNPTLPAGMTLGTTEGMIAAEAFLDFTPVFLADLVPAIRIHRTAYYRPRMSQQVALTP